VGWGPAPRIDALGHELRPMAAKYVRPFCLKQKNNYNALRPYMAHRQSSHRSQALHRVRVLFPPGHRMLHAGVVVALSRLHLQCHSRGCGGAPPRQHTYLLNMYSRKLL
jgi:hypothetical protein